MQRSPPPPFDGFWPRITCNPGAAGGPITNRKGELLGLLGRELKSNNTDTWINYAVPIQAKAEITDKDGKTIKLDMAAFVKEAMAGTFKERETSKDKKDRGAFHGIILVPNAVGVTPPYVEETIPGSPAAQAGLRPDDLIVYLEGELVPSIRVFRDMMRQIAPGSEVRLDIQRANRLITVKLKVTEQPKEKKS